MNNDTFVRDQKHFERLRIRLGINRYLKKLGRKDYAKQVYHKTTCPDEQTFYEIVDELVVEGLLRKETGHNGALIIELIVITAEEAHHV